MKGVKGIKNLYPVRRVNRRTNYNKRTGMIHSAERACFITLTQLTSGLIISLVQMFLGSKPDRVIFSVRPKSLKGENLNNKLGAYLQGIIFGRKILNSSLPYTKLLLYTPNKIKINSKKHSCLNGILSVLKDSVYSFDSKYPEWSLEKELERENIKLRYEKALKIINKEYSIKE